jgi:uncharacterized protein (TIGR00255 family)
MGLILSMTGYGRGEARGAHVVVTAQARSLNHRFLEITVKLGRDLSVHEAELRRFVQGRAARGRFDVSLTTHRIAGSGSVVRTDVVLGAAYAKGVRELADAAGVPAALTVGDLMRLPGVMTIEEAEETDDESSALALAAVGAAMVELLRMRQAEGTALAADLHTHLAALEAWVADLNRVLPAALQRIQARMRERVHALLGETPVDPGRIAQEVATWAAKSDVAEELARLASHCTQFRAFLADGGPVGRQLDFLAQELHREVNTIASKADDREMSARLLEARTLVERLREQVQNVE